MEPSFHYFGTQNTVRVGDRILVRRYFRRAQLATVVYIPGQSASHSELGDDQWAYQLENGSIFAVGYSPSQVPHPGKRIEFVSRPGEQAESRKDERFPFGPQETNQPANAVELAKQVLEADEAVLYGIFGVIAGSGYFPPQRFLNEFLMVGSDPCDQDSRMDRWQPFFLSHNEYDEIKAWWIAGHPGAAVLEFSVGCWRDWVQVILNPEDWGFPDGLPEPAVPPTAPDRGDG